MSTRMQLLRVAGVALIIAGATASGGAASAQPRAISPQDGFAVYEGIVNISNSVGGFVDEVPLVMRIDCAAGECVLTGALTGSSVWDIEQEQRLVIVDGHGQWEMSEWGDICGTSFWTPPGPMTIDIEGEEATFSRTGTDTPDDACLGEAAGFATLSIEATGTATLTDGEACVVDASCEGGLAPGPVGPEFGASDPSTLSTLSTPGDSIRPGNVLWALGLTVVLVLLVAFPAHLLNTAAEHGTDRFTTWWAGVRKRRVELPAVLQRGGGWPLAAVGVLVASLISAFVDPRFGTDAGGSLRIFGSILLAFVLDVAAGWVVLLLVLRRTQPDAQARLRFAPASLLLVLAAVLFSRITGFEPGIVFGLVAGVVIGATLATAAKARVALLGLGWSFVIGLVAWIIYAVLGATSPDPGAAGLFVQETLSAVAIGGMAVLPVALFPLRGMAGYDVFQWNRIVWGVAYLIGLFGFFFVLMPMPFAWQGVPLELGVWVGLYLVYAIGAVAIWAAITKPWAKEKTEKPATPAKPAKPAA